MATAARRLSLTPRGDRGSETFGRSPDPSAPSTARRSSPNDQLGSPAAPRWAMSPSSSIHTHVKEMLVVLDSVTSPVGASPASPLHITELENGLTAIRTHRTAGEKAVHVDSVVRVPPDGSVLDSLERLAYDAATNVAEGFNVCLMVASPVSLDASIAMLLDDSSAQLATLTLGYVMDFFQSDGVAMDVSAVRLNPSTGRATDLMRSRDDDTQQLREIATVAYRQKWGISGGACVRYLNDIADLAVLPPAAVAVEAAFDTDSGACDTESFIVLQCRIRRTQSLSTDAVSGDFDVVQTLTFVCLPPAPWLRPPMGSISTRFGFTDVAQPTDAAEAVAAAFFAAGGRAAAGAFEDCDDSAQIMIYQTVRGLLREALSGACLSTVIIPTSSSELANFLAVNDAVSDFSRLRSVTAREVHPASSCEVTAIATAEHRRKQAEAGMAALVAAFPEPAVLVSRSTWRIVGMSERAKEVIAPGTQVLHIARLGVGGTLTAAEVLELSALVMSGTPTTAALPHAVMHVKGCSTIITRGIVVSDEHLFLTLATAGEGPHRLSPTFAGRRSPAPATAPPSPVGMPGAINTAPLLATSTAATALEARKLLARQRQNASSATKRPVESSCSCVVA